MHNINFEYCYLFIVNYFLLYSSNIFHDCQDIYLLLFQFYLKIISFVGKKKKKKRRIDEELRASKVFQMGEIQLKLAKKTRLFYSQSMELTRGDRKP